MSISLTMTRRGALGLLTTAGAGLLAACGAPAAPPQAQPSAATASAAQSKPQVPQVTVVTAPAAGATTAPLAAASPVGATAGTPKRGGALRVSVVSDIVTLDPQSWGPRSGFNGWLSHDTLTNYDENLKPTPELAESWEQSADGKTIKLNLRKGVLFHTGREMTSADIVYNLARPLDPELQRTVASFTILLGFVPNGATFEATDKYTVTIKTPTPWVNVFDYFQVLYITDPETAKGPDSKTRVVGTGAFKFIEWVQGQYLSFERNPNYWRGGGRPYFDTVKINAKADGQTMVAELEAGATDIVVSPSWREFSRLKKDSKYSAILTPMPGYFFMIQPNTTYKPLDNKLVRQAMNYAIDRKRFVESTLQGEGIPMSTPWRANSAAFEASKANAYAFDLDKAKSVLNSAGITSLELDCIYAAGNSEYQDLAAIYQADLAKIGIKLALSTPDPAARLNAMQNQKLNGIYLAADTWAGMEPISFFTSSSIAGVRRNNGGFYSDRYTKLVADISAEPDANKRKAMYPELNDYLLDESFYMPVTGNPGKIVTTAKVKGIGARATDLFTVDGAWFE